MGFFDKIISSVKKPKDYRKHVFALIVAGGGGTRLWPVSRNNEPKQFLKLFGGKTLFQITFQRISNFLPPERIFVVTVSEDYKKRILKQTPLVKPENVIVEPARRNTAPAHGLGPLYIFKKDPDAVIINAAADHLVEPAFSYEKNMMVATRVAFEGDWMVCVGIKPTYPHTGYGYLKKGKKYKMVNSKYVYFRDSHVEKPELSVAEKFLKSGDYLWNANHYVWRADTFLNALKEHSPEVYKPLKAISSVLDTKKEESAIKSEYEKMPEIAVDYAVSEKAKNFLLVIADYRWTDIGDWKEVWENLPKDSLGNVVIQGDDPKSRVINIDTSDAMVYLNGRVVALVDVDNVVIVDTKDALLVCSKSRAQNVKKIVEKLKEEKKEELL